jgi:hypothetical protein
LVLIVTIETFRRVRILNNVDQEVINIENTMILAGGQGRGGNIILHPPSSTNVNDTTQGTIYLDAGNETITIRNNSNNRDTIVLDANFGNFLLGGNGRDGDIICFKSSATNTNYSDALANYRQRATIHFDGEQANLWMGGNNTDGDIVLFPGSATDLNDLNQATIHLDGQAGDINLRNADCAEEFDTFEENIDPGSVMVINRAGKLIQCNNSYDKKVAGVVSGAGKYKPGIILDRHLNNSNRRIPIALLGKVYCKVDANYSPVEQGDLLTSSDTIGHAMKATDPVKSFGTIIGKALKSLVSGRGLIPILVSLQ